MRSGRARGRRAKVAVLDAVVTIGSGGAARRLHLSDYLEPEAEELAATRANAWVKALRHSRVDGTSFRERFTYAGDSLWWFAELYLHKERAVLSAFRALQAAATLFDREAPHTLHLESADPVAALVLRHAAGARRAAISGVAPPRERGLAAMDARSTALMLGSLASPARPLRRPRGGARPHIAAFVHRAFWRGAIGEGGAESYIGPVLKSLEGRVPEGGLQYIGVGPAANFRARRWWTRPRGRRTVTPVEALVPRNALAGSIGLWAARHAVRRSLQRSADLRSAAVIEGCDLWPVLSMSLAGIALLQFPWSARAMDEAGSALRTVAPHAALTYAEAGGWGRALALEARRRGIPLAGLQHGFIYRHWLNYLHERDEMSPLPPPSRDAGFPVPAATFVFDEYAARHLVQAGHFPPGTVVVTGSPRFDELASRCRTLTAEDIRAARAAAGAPPGHALVLLVTKYTEVRALLPGLLTAMQALPGAHLAIKTHPAETAAPYEHDTAGVSNVRVLPAAAELAPLIRASRALVTVNSTVALDAMVLGVPALAIGLPNNLSPFVEAGGLAGARRGQDVGAMLRRLLYDEEFRQHLSAVSASIAAEYRMVPDGRAAERQAAAALGLAEEHAARSS